MQMNKPRNGLRAVLPRALREGARALLLWGALLPSATAGEPSPPSSQDPFPPLNLAFREAYADLRADVLARTTPVIIYSGDSLALLRDGQRTTAVAAGQLYHDLKTVAHIPLALYALLLPEADHDLGVATRSRLLEYRALVLRARDSSASGRLFSEVQRQRQLRLIDRSQAFMQQVSTAGRVSTAQLRGFAHRQSEDVVANTDEAARSQIDTLDAAMSAWLQDLSPEERAALRVVVRVTHMARTGNIVHQYFASVLGVPLDDRLGDDEVCARLVRAESVADEHEALNLLGSHLIDVDAIGLFFGDDLPLHRDILADPATRILEPRGSASVERGEPPQ